MAKTGRPRIEISKDHFEKLCAMQCTQEEIASFFSCSVDTVERYCKREYHTTFAEVLKSRSAQGKISLRRMAFKMAERNPGVLIFLCKNYLNMRDNPVEEKPSEGVNVIVDV